VMSDTLKDLAYDTAHYKGYVGHWVAAAVAHEVCSRHTGRPARRRGHHSQSSWHLGGWQQYAELHSASFSTVH
jgi:hypothetical protein